MRTTRYILLSSFSLFAVDLATDGTPIVISTNGGTCGAGSAICFEIKKANHNGIDRVRVGGTTVVTSGASTGFVVIGPDQTSGTVAGKTACSPDTGGSTCTNVLTPANDSSSTCSIEVNGPVKAVIKCTFSYKDGSGNAYLKGTNRYYFFKGLPGVKIVAILRNADNGNNNSFESAYKGHRGWEYRQSVNISGTLDYKIAKHASTETGTVATADAVRIYQAQSGFGSPTTSGCTADCGMNTDDTGYEIVKTVSGTPSTLATGTSTQFPAGWADIANSSGVGVTLGAYLMAGREMMSLEWTNGEARIGLMTPYNTWDSTYTGYYEPWPEHRLREVWISFHASAPSSPGNDFLSYQHRLVAYPSPTHYNATEVLGFKVPTAAEEFAWYTATEATANPAASGTPSDLADKGYLPSNDLSMYHYWSWSNPGSDTQADHRISDMMSLVKRGYTGRWIDAENFQRLAASMGTSMSDGFDWRDDADITGYCHPTITSVNSSKAVRDWIDFEHAHWYGLILYYYMTGEEWAKDGVDGYADRIGCPNLGSGGMENSRTVGGFLTGGAFLSEFYRDIGHADYTEIVNNVTDAWEATVKNTLCLNGDGTGCTYAGNGAGDGVSRVRGARRGGSTSVEVWIAGTDTWCGDALTGTAGFRHRAVASFQTSIFLNGAREFRRVMGPDWADYVLAGDLNYGVARFNSWEMYNDDGSGRWDQSGFNYYMLLDQTNGGCDGYTGSGPVPEDPDGYHLVGGRQTTHDTWPPIFETEGTLSAKEQKIKLVWHQLCAGITCQGATDYGGYQMGNVIYELNHPTGTLTDVTLSDFTDNGGGSYTLSWTVPTGADSYRIKYHTTRQLVDWLNYDKYATTYQYSPSTYAPWFAGTEITAQPVFPDGTTQTVTIATGQTGLSSANFSVKAMIASGSGSSETARGALGKVTIQGKSVLQ